MLSGRAPGRLAHETTAPGSRGGFLIAPWRHEHDGSRGGHWVSDMNAQIGALAAQLKRHEGCRLVAYRDTEGLWTIGYGHLLPDQSRDWTGHRISQTEADRFFEADLPIAVARAKAFANFSQLDPIRRAVLINMAFNLGRRLKQFKRLGAALFAHDYTAAAAEMLDSQWARQVKARATELASIMRTGQWPEETTP